MRNISLKIGFTHIEQELELEQELLYDPGV